MKSFNINSIVKVKLTELGKQVLEKEHNKFWSSRGILRDHPYKPPKEDKDGYVEFQLWSLMYQLGKYCILGCEPPLEARK